MGTKTRATLFAVAGIILAGAVHPLAAAVTVSGFVPFSSLDNGPLDEDPTVGVFAVSDTLVIDGTIDCSDAPPLPAHASGCAVTLVTGGDLVLEAGGAIVTENNRGGGNGGDVTLEAAGDVVLHGPAPALSGARISTARTTAANPGSQHAGAISVEAGGDVVLVSGSTVSAAAAGGAAGAIEIVAGGGVQLHGLVASGPTEILDADPLSGEVLVPATAQQAGGPITVLSVSTSGGSGVVVGATGVVVSQGDQQDAGLVLLEGCGIEVRGLVASLTREAGAAAVKLRSGEGLVVDGTDLGLPLDAPAFQGRLGAVRAGGSRGGSLSQRADLFARTDVQVLGPAPGQSASFAVSTAPGTKPHSSGGTVTLLSLEGGLLATGNAFEAGRSLTGDDGGAIDLQAAGDVVLDTAVVSAVGNFGNGAPGTGGDLVVQSYQGDVVWTGGTGDVRPVGGGVPASRRGSITLFYCGGIDLTGTTFPTVGPAVPPFPEVFQDCSLPGPELPPGDSLPVCNQPPVAADDDFTTDEDTAVAGDVLADNGHGADFDPGGDPLTVTEVNGSSADVGNLVVLPSGALLTLNADGTFTYDPNGQFEELAPGDEATDTFDYTVEEPGGLSDSANVTVTITGVDDDPVAVDDAATVAEDSAATTIDVLANDTDVDGGPKSIQSVTQPANGTVLITNGGADLSYEPAPDYCNDGDPTDDFTYTLNGGSTATVSVTVTCADDDPVAVDDAAIVAEDSAPTTIDVLANDTDADGGPKSIQSVTQPANGTVVITNGGADLTYQPAPDYCNDGSPTDVFTYTLNGGSTATVSVTVTCVDDAPVAVDDAATVAEDSAATTIDVLANETDLDGGPKAIQSVTQPANGTVVITNGGADLTYQPAANYCNDGSPTDDFTYTLNGGSTATVSVTVTCVNDPPVVADDAFDFLGNTELRVDSGTVATPHALETTGSGFGVLDNDADPVESDELTITSLTVGPCTDSTGPTFDCTVGGVGTVHMEQDGSFSFRPAAGDIDASEVFTYTVEDDGPPPASATGTVTLTRFERVWYVDPSADPGGDGTSASPFDSLDSLDGATGIGDLDADGDWIFVHEGALALNAPMELEASQYFIGEGAGLSLPVDLNGNGSPTQLVPPGNHPQLTHAGSDAVRVRQAIPVKIAGLGLASTTDNAIDLTTVGPLSGSGRLTIMKNELRGAGAEGIDVNLEAGTSGSLKLSVRNNTWDPAGTHAGNAFDLSRTAGTLALAFSANTDIVSGSPAGAAVRIDGGALGATTITRFAGNSVHPGTAGAGVSISNVTFDASTTTGGFQPVDGNNLLIGAPGDPVGDAGMTLANVEGHLFFDDLDVYGGTSALTILGTGGGMTFAVLPAAPDGSGTSVVYAGDGPAVDVTAAMIDLRLDDLDSTTTSAGIALSNVAGQLETDADASITKSSGGGTAFSVSGSSATVDYGGTLNVTSGSGVGLTGNSGAVSFTGQLTLTTGANPAFSATGGGTVTATQTDSTLTTTTGTPLTVNTTNIGAAGLRFASISSNGAASGVILNGNTGSTGRLVVGPAMGGACNSVATCAGGAIQNSTGPAISLTNTRNASFTEMYILNGATHGISGTTMADATSGAQPTFELKNSFLESPGDGDNESAIYFDSPGVANITGRMVVSDTTLQNFEDVGVHVGNNSGTVAVELANLTIDNNSDTNGEEGVEVEALGTANITLDVSGGTFNDLEGGGFNVFVSSGSGVIDVNIDGASITGTGGPDNFPTPPAITLSAEGATSQLTFDITNNDILDSSGDGIFIGHEGTIMGRITGNDVSGLAVGDALRIDTDTTGGNTVTILVDGNNFGNVVGSTGIGDDGIQVLHRDGTKQLNLTISNNQIANTASEAIRYFADDDVSGGGPGNNVRIESNTFSNIGDPNTIVIASQDPGTEVCTHITGNTLAGAGVPGITLQQSLSAVLQITQASTAALSAANEGATVTPVGTITFNGTCTTTPQPTNP